MMTTEQREKRRAYLRQYRATHPTVRPPGYVEARRKAAREKYASDPEYRERVKAAARQYRVDNPEKVRAACVDWANKNREKVRGYVRNWNRRNKDKMKAIVDAWRAAHPEAQAASAAKRRAHLLGLSEHVTNSELAQIMRWQQGHCFTCGAPINRNTKTLEHIVPLGRGGSNTAMNARWACRRCNFARQEKLLGSEWLPEESNWAGLNVACNRSIVEAHHALVGEGALVEEIHWHEHEMPMVHLRTEKFTILSSFAWSAPTRPLGALVALRQEYPNLRLFWDWEWYAHREAILGSMRAKAGIAKRIHARQCEFVELSWLQASDFFERWHIQGAVPSTNYYGLLHSGSLVATLSLGKGQITRYCQIASSPGALAKMISHIAPARPLRTFCEPRYGNGSGYIKAGFVEEADSAVSSYGYMQGPRFVSRALLQKANMSRAVEIAPPDLSESQIAEINGLRKLVSLPQKKFVLL